MTETARNRNRIFKNFAIKIYEMERISRIRRPVRFYAGCSKNCAIRTPAHAKSAGFRGLYRLARALHYAMKN
jgi:hypothetical protein